MKVFLLSDLVVHELMSMQLEGQWLTPGQFLESARLWVSRYAFNNQLSKELLGVLETEAIRIAERLMRDVEFKGQESQLERLLLDIHAVDYADPLSARILAASLEICRSKLCDSCSHCAERGEAKGACEDGWRCHPALQLLLCGTHATSR